MGTAVSSETKILDKYVLTTNFSSCFDLEVFWQMSYER